MSSLLIRFHDLRFSTELPRYGLLGRDSVQPVVDLLDATPVGEPIERAHARLLAPVVPGKIVAVGLNYRAHAAEMKKPVPEEPLLFLKPPSAVIGPHDAILLPPESGQIEHEAEMAVVLARPLRSATIDEARAAILGVTCCNDVTARDLQRKDVQYTRAKGFDSFAPIGPAIALGLDWRDLEVIGRVNGTIRQRGRTSDQIWDAATLLAFISRVMTLFPGDVVTTGTPHGVGPIVAGDTVTVEIEGVGILENHCEPRV